MARIFLVTIIVFLWLAGPQYVWAQLTPATPDEALTVANNWLHTVQSLGWGWDGVPDFSATSLFTVRDTANTDIVGYCASAGSRGYVIVSACREMAPIAEFSTESMYDPASTDKPAVISRTALSDTRDWLREQLLSANSVPDAMSRIATCRATWQRYLLPASEYNHRLHSETSALALDERLTVGPLVTTRWGQGDPYWDNCPEACPGSGIEHYWVGCVATAMAQVIKHWNYPPHGFGSASYVWRDTDQYHVCTTPPEYMTLEADFSDGYDWDNMPDSVGSGSSPAEKAAIAELCYEAGIATHMNYGSWGSGANPEIGLRGMADHMGYAPGWSRCYIDPPRVAASIGYLRSNFQLNRPVLIIGYIPGGHCWVGDGIRICDDSGTVYLHENMGWSSSQCIFWRNVTNLPNATSAYYNIKPLTDTLGLNLLFPTHRDTLLPCSTYTIRWTPGGGSPTVNLYGGPNGWEPIAMNVPNTGSYVWTFDQVETNNGIRIQSTADTLIGDFVSFYSRVMNLWWENGPSWACGQPCVIQWNNPVPGNTVTLEYWFNEGPWQVIDSAVPNIGHYNWTYPSDSGEGGINIRVTSNTCPMNSSVLEYPFYCIAIHDDGLQGLQCGQTATVSWGGRHDEDSVAVAVTYNADAPEGACTWETLTPGIHDDYEYSWQIPSRANGTHLRLAVTSTLFPEMGDTSEVFTVTCPASSVLLVSPSCYSEYTAREVMDIRWNANANQNAQLAVNWAYPTGTWHVIHPSLALSQGNFSWQIPDGFESSHARLRLRVPGDTLVSSVSRHDLHIVAHGPIQHFVQPFAPAYSTTVHNAHAVLEAVPFQPATPMHDLVLQYRLIFPNDTGDWQNQQILRDHDTYPLNLTIPDRPGICEYRTWAWDGNGAFGSYPAEGTDFEDPKVGARFHFAFGRGGTTVVTAPLTIYTPDTLWDHYEIAAGGNLTFRPGAGGDGSLFVTENASIRFRSGGPRNPQLTIAGLDTLPVSVMLTPDAQSWGGIETAGGYVKLEHVLFNTGAPALTLNGAAVGVRHHFLDVSHTAPLDVWDTTPVEGSLILGQMNVRAGTLDIDSHSGFSFIDGGVVLVFPEGAIEARVASFGLAAGASLWTGIQVAGSATGTPSRFQECDYAGAEAAIFANRGTVELEGSHFTGNHTGILAVNGASVWVGKSTLRGNGDGILASSLSTVRMYGSRICQNTRAGIVGISRASFDLSQCVVDSNAGDGFTGGLGLYGGCSAFLECTAIERNDGPGVSAYGGALVLSTFDNIPEAPWHNNSISFNHPVTDQGQITLHGPIGVGLLSSTNRILDSSDTIEPKLIAWPDHHGDEVWSDVFWGSENPDEILHRLPDNIHIDPISNGWNPCPDFHWNSNPPYDDLRIFLEANRFERRNIWEDATNIYRHITLGDGRFRFAAIDRLLAVDYARGEFDPRFLMREALTQSGHDKKTAFWSATAWALLERNDDGYRAAHDSAFHYASTDLEHVQLAMQAEMYDIYGLMEFYDHATVEIALEHFGFARDQLARLNVWQRDHIAAGDTAIMYAPTTVTTSVGIEKDAALIIKPYPGAQNARVRMVDNSSFKLDQCPHDAPPHFHPASLTVEGDSVHRVTLDALACAPDYRALINNPGGWVTLKNTDLVGTNGIAIFAEASGECPPVVCADSCTFLGFADGVIVRKNDAASYLRHCRFDNVGRGGRDIFGTGYGSAVALADGCLPLDHCQIINSPGIGLFGWQTANAPGGAATAVISNTTISGCTGYGVLAWEGSYFRLNCCEISQNGRELPEVWVDGGLFFMREGYNSITGDKPLIRTLDPEFVGIYNGMNNFRLNDANDYYLLSETTHGVWDVTNNYWTPIAPGDAEFFNHLVPAIPSCWDVSSYQDAPITCDASAAIAAGTLPAPMPGMTAEQTAWESIESVPHASVSTVAQIRQFLNTFPGSRHLPAALVLLAQQARPNSAAPISMLLSEQANQATEPVIRQLAQRLVFVSMAEEGHPASALTGLENLIEQAPSQRDSLRALIDAMYVYYFHRGEVKERLAVVRNATLPELLHRVNQYALLISTAGGSRPQDVPSIPTQFHLYQNYPNPFNPVTEIRFDLPTAVRAELKIYNILGQEVVTLLDGTRPAGAYSMPWDGRTTQGQTVVSGMYVYRLKAGNFVDNKKMMLIR